MHPFRQFIHNYSLLTDAEWQAVEQQLKKTVAPPYTLLLEEGKICRHLYFLEQGLLRFYVLKDGNEINKYFTDIPYCFTSQRSFTTQTPARESIETLETCVLWSLSYTAAHELLNLPGWAVFIRKLVQEVQTFTDEILEALQTETAENRYKFMLRNNDPLLRRVPLKHIASYLGIAPQSLSRIRKNVRRSGT